MAAERAASEERVCARTAAEKVAEDKAAAEKAAAEVASDDSDEDADSRCGACNEFRADPTGAFGMCKYALRLSRSRTLSVWT